MTCSLGSLSTPRAHPATGVGRDLSSIAFETANDSDCECAKNSAVGLATPVSGSGPHRETPASHILRGPVVGDPPAMLIRKHVEEPDKDGAGAVALVPVPTRGRKAR
jgi:hypothetical protein